MTCRVVLASLVVASFLVVQSARPQAPGEADTVRALITLQGPADVAEIIAARRARLPASRLRELVQEARQRNDVQRADLVESIETMGGRVRRSFWLVNGMAADIPRFAVNILRADARVKSVAPDYPTSPSISLQLELAEVFPYAWNAGGGSSSLVPLAQIGGRGVVVAIADSGFDLYYVPDHTVTVPGQNPEFLLPSPTATYSPNPIYTDTLGDWPASVYSGDYPDLIEGTRILRAVDLYDETGCSPFEVGDTDHFPPSGYEDTAEDINFDGGQNFMFGHGTSVSHAASGAGSLTTENCTTIMAGPAFRSGLLLYKIIDDSSQRSFAWGVARVAAVEEAVSDGADVLNMSFGGIPAPDALEDVAFDTAALADLLVFVPAGNEGIEGCSTQTPGLNYEIEHAFFNGLVIAYTDAKDVLLDDSSQGDLTYLQTSLVDPSHFMSCPPGDSDDYQDPIDDASFQWPTCSDCLIFTDRTGVNLSAPGEDVRLVAQDLNNAGLADPDPSCTEYVIPSGSSLASPLAAGVGAMVRGANPSLSALEAKAILINSVNQGVFVNPPHECGGNGRLNANRAVESALGQFVGSGTIAPENPLFPGSQTNNYIEAWVSLGTENGGNVSTTWNRLDLDNLDVSDLRLEIMEDGYGDSINWCSDHAEDNWDSLRYGTGGLGGAGFDGSYVRFRVRISVGNLLDCGDQTGAGSNSIILDASSTELEVALANTHAREPFRLAKPFEVSAISPASTPALGTTLHIMGPMLEQASDVNSVTFSSPSMDTDSALSASLVNGTGLTGTWINAAMPPVAPSSPVTVTVDVDGVVSQFDITVGTPSAKFDREYYYPGDTATLDFTWPSGGDVYYVTYGIYAPDMGDWWPNVGPTEWLGQFHMIDTTFHSFLVGTTHTVPPTPPPASIPFGIPNDPVLVNVNLVVQTISRVPNPVASGALRLISAPTVAHIIAEP